MRWWPGPGWTSTHQPAPARPRRRANGASSRTRAGAASSRTRAASVGTYSIHARKLPRYRDRARRWCALVQATHGPRSMLRRRGRGYLHAMRIETLAAHAGLAVDPATGAVTPPIHLSTTFEREPDGSYRAGHVYTRTSNPNRRALEDALATLEGGAAALAFASGSAATMSVLQALQAGDHVLAPDDAYYGTLRTAREL